MMVISIHVGPTVLVWSSVAALAFLSNGCLAFRLVNGSPQYCTVNVCFFCFFSLRGGVHSAALKQWLFVTGRSFVLQDLFRVHSNSNRCAALCSIWNRRTLVEETCGMPIKVSCIWNHRCCFISFQPSTVSLTMVRVSRLSDPSPSTTTTQGCCCSALWDASFWTRSKGGGSVFSFELKPSS